MAKLTLKFGTESLVLRKRVGSSTNEILKIYIRYFYVRLGKESICYGKA